MATTRRRRPSKDADPAFLEALTEIAARIAATLAAADRKRLPVRMYLAGGAAMHYYTGARATEDVDAVFSTRVMLPQDLEVYYVDVEGEPRLLYFDRSEHAVPAVGHDVFHQRQQFVGPARRDPYGDAQIAPMIAERLDVGRIVVLESVEQAFEPLRAHRFRHRCRRDDRHQRIDGVVRRATQSTGRTVDLAYSG